MRLQLVIDEGDILGLLLVAINDAGDETLATNCTGGPLASPATCRGLKLDDLGHSQLQYEGKRLSHMACLCANLPPGVTGVRARADIQISPPGRNPESASMPRKL